MFTIIKKMKGGRNSLGRAGVVRTPHGDILTPAFVPVGTKATMKGLTPDSVREAGAQVVLANTYHLYLQPGDGLVRQAGGLGKFMNWSGPTITDSGGFQVFSLGVAYGKGIGKITKNPVELILPEGAAEDGLAKLVKIDHDGVMFRSHLDGSAHYFTPEKSIEIQHNLGADITFAFDECTSPTESVHYQSEALDRTHRWAKRSLERHKQLEAEKGGQAPVSDIPSRKSGTPLPQALFGIVQGGRHEELRKESAKFIGALDFDGFGIGGSFAKEDMTTAVQWVNEILPEEKPRHLLGIGDPLDIFNAVERGCDLFDCVAPTRNGRNGTVYTRHGQIHLYNTAFRADFSPLDAACTCYTCKNFTKSYVAHLFHAKEMLGGVLASIHNVHFIVNLVAGMRQAILDGTFEAYKQTFFATYKA